MESPAITYNFEVEDFHTYYVGSAEVLVHNRGFEVDRMSRREVNTIKNKIEKGEPYTFKSKKDAENFIEKTFPTFHQERAGARSAQGWHFDFHSVDGISKEHINIYSKSLHFRTHIFWEDKN